MAKVLADAKVADLSNSVWTLGAVWQPDSTATARAPATMKSERREEFMVEWIGQHYCTGAVAGQWDFRSGW